MNRWQVRLGIDVFTGLVVVSVGVALAGLTWRLAGYSGAAPVAAAMADATGNPVDISGFLALAPFGTVVAASDGLTDGSLHLKGILLAMPESASSALVAGSDGKVASYGIGAALGGGVVAAITADQVILRTSRGLETLGFRPAAGGPAPAMPGAGAKGAGFVAVGAAVVPGPAPAPAIGARSAEAPAPAGLRIGSTAPAALIAAGLQPGDIVENINGTPVTAGMNADLIGRVLASAALHGGSAGAVVLRNGTRVSLRLAIH